jgi:hypothetical protein
MTDPFTQEQTRQAHRQAMNAELVDMDQYVPKWARKSTCRRAEIVRASNKGWQFACVLGVVAALILFTAL